MPVPGRNWKKLEQNEVAGTFGFLHSAIALSAIVLSAIVLAYPLAGWP